MMCFHGIGLECINVHTQCLFGVLGEISVSDVAMFKGVGLDSCPCLQLAAFGGCDCLVSDLPFVLLLCALLQVCLFSGPCASFLAAFWISCLHWGF